MSKLKERILKAPRRKKKRNHIQENHIRLSADLQQKLWRLEHDIFKVMKEKTQQSSIVSMQQGYQWSGCESPPLFTVLSVSPFFLVNICFIYLGAPISSTYMFMHAVSSSCIHPFIITKCLSLL